MDQRTLWNALHRDGFLAAYSQTPTEFAREAASFFPDHAKIIELGCGFGADAAFFAQQGCSVIATDFSDVVVARNRREHNNVPGLDFQVVDMSDGSLPFQADGFDGVYARLSLHYYLDQITRLLFQDIHRVLKRGGRLAFMCKSTNDPLYGKGQQLEKNMFENKGHVRHFFDESYAKTLLDGYYTERLEKREESLYGNPSAYIKIIAQKML